MQRNTTKKGPKQTRQVNQEEFPEEVYSDLELAKKIACYKFWSFLFTDGAQGWSPYKTPGSIYHLRSSSIITKGIKEGSWPKVGKVSLFVYKNVSCIDFLALVLLTDIVVILAQGYGNTCITSKSQRNYSSRSI